MAEASCLKIHGRGDNKCRGYKVEMRQTEGRSVWLKHRMEKNVDLRISTNCKYITNRHSSISGFNLRPSLNMNKLGNRTTLCRLCLPPADGNSSSRAGVIYLQERVDLGTILWKPNLLQNRGASVSQSPPRAESNQVPETK